MGRQTMPKTKDSRSLRSETSHTFEERSSSKEFVFNDENGDTIYEEIDETVDVEVDESIWGHSNGRNIVAEEVDVEMIRAEVLAATIAVFNQKNQALLKDVVSTWYRVRSELKMERELVRLREELLQYRMSTELQTENLKQQDQSFSTMSMMSDQDRADQTMSPISEVHEDADVDMLRDEVLAATNLALHHQTNQVKVEMEVEEEVQSDLSMERELSKLRKELMRYRLSTEGLARKAAWQAIASRLGGNAAALAKHTLTAWKTQIYEVYIETLKEEVMRYRVSQDGMARKAAAKLAGSQDSVLGKEVLTVWHKLVKELRQENELERLREEVLQHRLAKEGLARQAAGALFGSSAKALTKEAITGWRTILHELKEEKLQDELQKLREEVLQHRLAKEGLARQAAGALFGSSAKALTKEAITGWRMILHELANEKLREELMRYKISKEGMARRAAATLVGSQATTLCKEVMAAWHKLAKELKKENELQELRDEVLRYRLAKEGMVRRAAATLAGSQITALGKEVMTAWHKAAKELKKELELQLLREEVVRSRLAREGLVRQAAGALFGCSAKALTKEAITGWRTILHELANEKLREELLRYKVSKAGMARQAAARLAGSQDVLLGKEVLTSWHKLAKDLKTENELQKLREEVLKYRISKKGLARKAASALVGSGASAVLKEAITSWRMILHDLANERIREELMRYKISKAGMARKAAARLAGSLDTLLGKEVLSAWHKLAKELKTEHALEKLREEILQYRLAKEGLARQAAGALFGSSAKALVKEAITGWRTILHQLANEKLREELMRYKVAREGLVRGAASALAGSQDTALCKEVVAVWHKLTKELKTERELQKLREEVLQYRLAKEGLAHQAAAALMGGNAKVLAKDAIIAWKMVIHQLAHERLRKEMIRYRSLCMPVNRLCHLVTDRPTMSPQTSAKTSPRSPKFNGRSA